VNIFAPFEVTYLRSEAGSTGDAEAERNSPRTPFLLRRRKPPVGLLVCSKGERIFGRAGESSRAKRAGEEGSGEEEEEKKEEKVVVMMVMVVVVVV
jgi:hypothetical protein